MPEHRPQLAAIRLDAGDALELAQLLDFLGDWFDGHDADLLAASFHRFVGATGYELAELQADLARFALLLGKDGERLLKPDQHSVEGAELGLPTADHPSGGTGAPTAKAPGVEHHQPWVAHKPT